MRAVLVKDGKGPIKNLYIGQVEKPVPKDGQVVVKVSTTHLNCVGGRADFLRLLRLD